MALLLAMLSRRAKALPGQRQACRAALQPQEQPHSTDSSLFIRRLQLCRVPHKGHDLFHTPGRGLIIQDGTQGPYSKCLKESPLIGPRLLSSNPGRHNNTPHSQPPHPAASPVSLGSWPVAMVADPSLSPQLVENHPLLKYPVVSVNSSPRPPPGPALAHSQAPRTVIHLASVMLCGLAGGWGYAQSEDTLEYSVCAPWKQTQLEKQPTPQRTPQE